MVCYGKYAVAVIFSPGFLKLIKVPHEVHQSTPGMGHIDKNYFFLVFLITCRNTT